MSAAIQKLLKEREAFAKGASTAGKSIPSGQSMIPSKVPAAAAVAASPLASAVAGMRLPSVSLSAGAGLIQILFYTSLLLFIVFLILTFVHFTIRPIFNLSPTDNAILGTIGTNDMLSEWEKESKPDTKAEFTPPKSCDITVSMDVYPTGDYTSIVAPKVFFYRSMAAATIAANARVSDLISALATTNIVAYFDNQTEDLIVAAVTSVNNQKRLESSPAITNLPTKTPFRLTIVLTSNFFEVYIDGKLRSTVTLKGTLVTSVEPFWSQPIRFDKVVRVGRLHYWPRAITATEIRNLEPAISSNFFIQKT